MMFDDHRARSVANCGYDMPEVHKYLDQYFPVFRTGTHRLILHHQLGVSKLVNMFGDNYGYEGRILVRQVAELHIKDDLGFVPESWHEMEDLKFFLDDREEREFEHCLRLEFP